MFNPLNHVPTYTRYHIQHKHKNNYLIGIITNGILTFVKLKYLQLFSLNFYILSIRYLLNIYFS